MQIECRNCAMYQSSHCDDCLVTALLHPPEGVVELDDDLDGSIEALQSSGLIPVLRFRPRDPASRSEEAPEEATPGLSDTG